MESLNKQVQVYTECLRIGNIQKAYKGILTFMSELKGFLERQHTDYLASAMYFGYMDMTYFAFTPPALRDKKLKIAIVYLHEEYRFELWLAANNRSIQAAYIKMLESKDLGEYILSHVQPGVDAIVSALIIQQPDFDQPDSLKIRIAEKLDTFVNDMALLIK